MTFVDFFLRLRRTFFFFSFIGLHWFVTFSSPFFSVGLCLDNFSGKWKTLPRNIFR